MTKSTFVSNLDFIVFITYIITLQIIKTLQATTFLYSVSWNNFHPNKQIYSHVINEKFQCFIDGTYMSQLFTATDRFMQNELHSFLVT